MAPCSSWSRLAITLTLLAGLAPTVGAQFVYSLSTDGRVAVNAAEIANLKGGATVFGDGPPSLVGQDEIWLAQVIDGADWWALRFDGNVNRNAENVYSLPVDDELSTNWIDLLILEGAVWALRTDGRVDINGAFAVSQPQGGSDSEFTRLDTDGTNVWILREDGRVFRDLLTDAVFKFNGPDSVGGFDDGEDAESVWALMDVDPVDGTLWGLRRDGTLQMFDPGAPTDGELPEATEITTLPFEADPEDVDFSDVYVAFDFLDDGTWVALRVNGKVYRESDVSPFFTEVVDLPGGSTDNPYVDVLPILDGWLTLRQDGQLFDGVDTEPVAIIGKKSHVELNLGSEAPDLTNAKTKKPVVANTTIKPVTGHPMVLDVIVTDVDTPDEDLVLTPDVESIPPGAVWDDETRTLTWDDPGPAGSYKFKLEVDDGVNKTVRKTYKLKVKDPDDNPDKNIKPFAAKIKKAQPLDGTPFSMRIETSDRDGDEVTVMVQDPAVYPYTAGAAFDEKTATFTWTPVLADVGKVKLTFLVSDGTVTTKRKITIQPKATLLTFP